MPFTSPLCPTCGQRIPPEPKPVPKKRCAKCGEPIKRRHKYYFGEDGRVQHRVCGAPDCYVLKPAPARP